MTRTFWTRFRSSTGDTVMVTDQDGMIVALGGDNLVLSRRPEDTVRDLGGQYLTPGFWDSHIHLVEYANRRSRLAFAPNDPIEKILADVREKAWRTPPTQWILGGGWNKQYWPYLPTHRQLDAVSPDHPVILWSLDFHSAWVNSRGLLELGISRVTQAEPGGIIERDEHGQPTGILREAQVFWAADRVFELNRQDITRDMLLAQNELNRFGLVGVTAMETKRGFRVLEEHSLENPRTLRVEVMLQTSLSEPWFDSGIPRNPGDSWLKFKGFKLFSDGSLGSQTAWMKKPYEGQASQGVWVLDRDQLWTRITEANWRGFPVAVHAIGDQAVAWVAEIFQQATPRMVGEIQNRIEHAQLVDPEDVRLLAHPAIAVSMQPVHLLVDRDIAEQYWGERSRFAFPTRQLVEASVRLLFGSDAPVATPDIKFGLWAAVHRSDPGHPYDPWHPGQALTPEEAIKAYTESPALSGGRPSGRLSPGLWADFTVWRFDPVSCLSRRAFEDLHVSATIVGGTEVWRDY